MMHRVFGVTVCLAASLGAQWPYSTTGYTNHGEWKTEVLVEPAWWSPGLPLQVSAKLTMTEAHTERAFRSQS